LRFTFSEAACAKDLNRYKTSEPLAHLNNKIYILESVDTLLL
jgi:hypothetical protein